MANGVLAAGAEHEADGRGAVRRAVHDQVVLCLERAAGHRRVREQQPVQVQDQASVQRSPVLLEQVVLSVAVACQFLFAAVAQRRRLPVDDPLGAVGVRDDDTLDRGRGGDALDAGPRSAISVGMPRHIGHGRAPPTPGRSRSR